MRITRLRLTGFKSFVETTDFVIQPGLTGIVGPNGCGKSNLLESLRWVMGATSAKAMRGDGMDDVIFGGTDGRPARGHAEVILTLENDEGRAPPPFHAEPVLEVSRRIDRGEGSTYRINGTEVRARDVQLLFADASTGANSPALVRQGQISELIAAKPQNRRRILEEAAGISGLHGRRDEAELRVQAAETNLGRLGDLSGELESALAKLRREARAAARYKKLGAEIRGLRAAVAHSRWVAAMASEQEAARNWVSTNAVNETAAREVASASKRAIEAANRLPPMRDEQLLAATLHQRALLEQDRVDRSLAEATATSARLAGDLSRINADLEREEVGGGEAKEEGLKADTQLAALELEAKSAPALQPQLDSGWREADAERQRAELDADNFALESASAKAKARAAHDRVAEVDTQLCAVGAEHARTLAERDVLDRGASAEFLSAETERALVSDLSTATSTKLEGADADRSRAVADEAVRRTEARAKEEALAEAAVEMRALERLTPTATTSGGPLLDKISAETGFELALAAALGDDIGASMQSSASVFWSDSTAYGAMRAPPWPPGVRPLAEIIDAPPRLAARLSLIGLVEADDGDALQPHLPDGARLVSVEGGLWRWDGYTVRPGAPSSAAVRLRQKSRIASLSEAIARLQPAATEAKAAHRTAAAMLAEVERLVQALRSESAALERRRALASTRLDACRRQEDIRLARLALADQTALRLGADRDAISARLVELQRELPRIEDHSADDAKLAGLRAGATAAREAAALARSALEVAVRESAARERRLTDARTAAKGWTARAERSRARLKDLAIDRDRATAAIEAAKNAPAAIRADSERLLDEVGVAETRRAKADDDLLEADAARTLADREARAAEGRTADAREERASAAARLEAARARVVDFADALTQLTGLPPSEVAARLAKDAIAIPAAAPGAESHLESLEREQAAMGAVNLLAEDEAEAVAARLGSLIDERNDLTGALAKLRQAIAELNAEGRTRLNAAFLIIDGYFRELFTTLFQGGAAELRLVESEDPLEAGLEIFACPPGKRMALMSLMSGGEQALTAVALIFAVFLANPAPICVLDEVDAPLDDANVERFCNLLAEMRRRAATRFITITHNPLTMSRMDRLFGVTMRERGVSQLVSVDLTKAEALAAH